MTTEITTPEAITSLLAAALAQSGLTAEQATTLDKAFSPFYAKAYEQVRAAAAIAVTDATQLTEMKQAKATRLALRNIRTDADKERERQKSRALLEGRAVQACYNELAAIIEPIEARLEADEKFAERAEAARKAALKSEREALLLPFGINPALYMLGEMRADEFTALLAGTKAAHEAKIAEAARVEAERLAAIEAAKVERARIQAENDRLQREAAEKEAALQAERQRVAAEKAAAEAAAKAERDRLQREADARAAAAAEVARKEREAVEAKARAEREQAAREQRAKDEVARIERERLESEARIAREAQKHADALLAKQKAQEETNRKAAEAREAKRVADEAAAAKKAAAAPDKEKLLALSVALLAIEIPDFNDPAIISYCAESITNLAATMRREANKL